MNAWQLTWSIDETVSSNCSSTTNCVQVSNSGVLGEYRDSAKGLFRNNRRLLKKLRKAAGEPTRRWKALKRRNKKAYEAALAAADEVPLSNLQCS